MVKERKQKPKGRLAGGLEPKREVKNLAPKNEAAAGKILTAMLSCCSSTWAQDVQEQRVTMPIEGMRLSKFRVLTPDYNIYHNPRGTVGTQRWTPARNVRLESILDRMSVDEANRYYHPSAITYGTREYRQYVHKFTLPEELLQPERIALNDWPRARAMSGRWHVRVRCRGVSVARGDDGQIITARDVDCAFVDECHYVPDETYATVIPRVS